MAFSADELNPTALDRVRAHLRPGWSRTVLARRVAAGALVLLAAALAIADRSPTEGTTVVVASHDLAPGSVLTDADVTLTRRAADIPSEAVSELTIALGATVSGAVRAGEILTDVRLLGSALTTAAAGPDARVVPVHLSDAALLDVLRAGDVVDVVASSTHSENAKSVPLVLANRAIVVLVTPKSSGRTAADRVVMVALPAEAATSVASASLTESLTVTLH